MPASSASSTFQHTAEQGEAILMHADACLLGRARVGTAHVHL